MIRSPEYRRYVNFGIAAALLLLGEGCAERSPVTSRITSPESRETVTSSAPPYDAAGSGPTAYLPAWADIRQDEAGSGSSASPPVVSPDWRNNVAPGELCGTYQHYVAELIAEGKDPGAAVCAGNGSCDSPAARDMSIPTSTTPIKTFRLFFHVFCLNNGSNCATTQSVIDGEVAKLNANFAPWRIQVVYETEFVRDTKYRVLDSGEENMMKKRYARSPATKLNIYVVDAGNLSWGEFPWYSWALTYQGGIVLDQRHIGGQLDLLTHEVGHCLGLWHTFHGVSEVTACSDCYEPAGRSAAQGDVTGDFCSDTPPTPRNYTCVDPTDIDPCSGLLWGATALTNFMSYGNTCLADFTPQQAGRMHCWTAAVLGGWLL